MSLRARVWLVVIYWLVIAPLLALSALLLARMDLDFDRVVFEAALVGLGAVGSLIVLRRPENGIGWLFCATGLLNLITGLANDAAQYATVTQPGALGAAAPWVAWVGLTIGDSAWAVMVTFTFLLFPTGRLPSPRWRLFAWAVAALIIYHTLVSAFTPGPFDDWPSLSNPLGRPLPGWLVTLDHALDTIVLLPVILSLGSLVGRYRAVRGEQRQQIKWLAYVAGLLVLTLAVSVVVEAAAPTSALKNLLDGLITIGFLAFPLAVGLSILRYRLLDIDVLIRRTLIYGALTAALALAYALSTIVLQQVVGLVSDQESPLVIVASTLAIAALFTPLRRRIQTAMDRRFYRPRIDAAQTLAAFGLAARDEVDLDRLQDNLKRSAANAFQPAHVSVWLPRERGA
jgi:hypothetical protein